MAKYKCKCGFEGDCYGAPTSNGVSAPWCPKCQRNNGLSEIVTHPTQEQREMALKYFNALWHGIETHMGVDPECKHWPDVIRAALTAPTVPREVVDKLVLMATMETVSSDNTHGEALRILDAVQVECDKK